MRASGPYILHLIRQALFGLFVLCAPAAVALALLVGIYALSGH